MKLCRANIAPSLAYEMRVLSPRSNQIPTIRDGRSLTQTSETSWILLRLITGKKKGGCWISLQCVSRPLPTSTNIHTTEDGACGGWLDSQDDETNGKHMVGWKPKLTRIERKDIARRWVPDLYRERGRTHACGLEATYSWQGGSCPRRMPVAHGGSATERRASQWTHWRTRTIRLVCPWPGDEVPDLTIAG